MKIKDKQNKGPNNTNKKEPRNIKEIVPLSSKEPRTSLPITIPENISKLPQRNFVSSLQPVILLPEWPSNEEIKVNNL